MWDSLANYSEVNKKMWSDGFLIFVQVDGRLVHGPDLLGK